MWLRVLAIYRLDYRLACRAEARDNQSALCPLGSDATASPAPRAKAGGARRDRTDDLMLAKHALSQLSYGPVNQKTNASRRSLSHLSSKGKRTRSSGGPGKT